jgi:hypothetical protein
MEKSESLVSDFKTICQISNKGKKYDDISFLENLIDSGYYIPGAYENLAKKIFKK